MRSRWKAAAATAAGAAATLAATGLLSGCGTAGASVTAVSADTSVEMIVGSQASTFNLSLECGAAQEARRQGINLIVAGTQASAAADQLPLVSGVIVGNPDAVIIDPVSPTALNQSLYVAQENDTKVVFVDSSVADKFLGASRISSDNAAGGKIAADNLGRLLGGRGSVAVVTAPDGGSAAAGRIAGFRNEMAARYPGITVLAMQDDASGSVAGATSLVTGDLSAHPGLAAVLSMTDTATQGAMAGISQAHKKGTVKLATFDATPLQMTGLVTGAIQLTVAQEPAVEGADAVDQAVSAIADRKVVPQVATPMIAITPQNMSKSDIKPYIYDGICSSSLRGYMTAG